MALFRKDDIYQEDENLHPGGNAERTQVAVEYNDPVVRTPGGADAEYLLLSFCHMLIMWPWKITQGLQKLGCPYIFAQSLKERTPKLRSFSKEGACVFSFLIMLIIFIILSFKAYF